MAVEEIIVQRAEETDPYIDDIVSVYDRAFREPPYNHNSSAALNFRDAFMRHRTLPDFELVLLYEDGQMLGFTYGHTNEPGQWWYQQIAPALSDQTRSEVFDGAWTVVELAVDPNARRRGLGRHLLRLSLSGKRHRWAVLSTMQAESAAVKLYEAEGFKPLLTEFVFPEGFGFWVVLARRCLRGGGAIARQG